MKPILKGALIGAGISTISIIGGSLGLEELLYRLEEEPADTISFTQTDCEKSVKTNLEDLDLEIKGEIIAGYCQKNFEELKDSLPYTEELIVNFSTRRYITETLNYIPWQLAELDCKITFAEHSSNVKDLILSGFVCSRDSNYDSIEYESESLFKANPSNIVQDYLEWEKIQEDKSSEIKIDVIQKT